MIKIRKKLKSQEGSMLVYGVALMLSMLLIVAGVTEYFRLKTITSNIEDILQSAVINTTIENYENVFSSNREGYVSANLYNDNLGRWEDIVDEGDIYGEIRKLLGLKKEGEEYVKYSDEEIEYKISNLEVKIQSPPLQAGRENKFIAESTIDFEIPHAFAWEHLPSLKLKLKVRSEHMLMF